MTTIIISMCMVGWMAMARFIRNQVVIFRDRDYNLASRCLGSSTLRIVIKNLLPQMVSVIMLQTSLAIPGAIGDEVFLTYIGLGIPTSQASLGNLVEAGRVLMMDSTLRYQLVFPAAVVAFITIAFYIIGNAFSDAADPQESRLRRRGMENYLQNKEVILSVKDLSVCFSLRGKSLHAIRGVSLDVYKGESLAIVGESGSGKSVLTKNFIGLLDKNGTIDKGEILFEGMDLAKFKTEREWAKIRGKKIAMVMQDPMTSLNPLKTIGWQISEALILNRGMNHAQAKAETLNILKDVGISEPERRYKQYPHEFSGGMRQRVVIAIAVACSPEILICDEPTTALDVTIQAQILSLIKDLCRKYGMTTIYITHDLGVVANVADRIAVMYAGDIVEVGTSEEVFFDPKHPYTWALMSSLPQLGEKGHELYSIKGTPPKLFGVIRGDAFAPRNPQALKIDYMVRPPYFEVSPTHKARTWLLDPRAPKIDPPECLKRLKELENIESGDMDE